MIKVLQNLLEITYVDYGLYDGGRFASSENDRAKNRLMFTKACRVFECDDPFEDFEDFSSLPEEKVSSLVAGETATNEMLPVILVKKFEWVSFR